LIPVDFLAPVRSSGASQAQQDLALAQCLAQSEALMDGFNEEGVEPYRMHPGNKPSTTILFPELTPEALGQLIVLYEHKVFMEGVSWGVNSFDQWGVELGKKLATTLIDPVVTGKGYKGGNSSTRNLLTRIRKQR
jgi:glucose-6-phosphate isomerase